MDIHRVARTRNGGSLESNLIIQIFDLRAAQSSLELATTTSELVKLPGESCRWAGQIHRAAFWHGFSLENHITSSGCELCEATVRHGAARTPDVGPA